MAVPSVSARLVRFGTFELDVRSGELRKAGVRIPIQEQPARILARLLERPGELVAREELRQELWPADTFVDFEHGLNAAIKRLRDALGDSADTPRFIETLPRRGYRFIAPVTGAGTDETPASDAQGFQLRRPLRAGLLLVAIGAAGAISFWTWRSGIDPSRAAPSVATHTTVDVPAEAPLPIGVHVPAVGFDSTTIALSRDGSQLAFIARSGGTTQVFLRRVDSIDVRPLPGTEGAIHPFFSPDGRWIGFLTDNAIKKVAIEGESAATLVDVRTPTAAWWIDDRWIDFTYESGRRFARVAADGGEFTDLLGPPSRTRGVISDVLPGGRWAFGTRHDGGASDNFSSLVLISLERDEVRPLRRRGFRPIFAPPDRLVFSHAGELLAIDFDPTTLKTSGTAVVIASNVAMNSLLGSSQAAVSGNGVLAYVSGGDHAVARLTWVDRNGTSEAVPIPPRVYGGFRLSPDGARVAMHVADVTDYIAIYPVRGGDPQYVRASHHLGVPVWSPDGRRLALMASPVDGTSPRVLMVLSVEDPSDSRELWSSEHSLAPMSWHPRDGVIAITEGGNPYRSGFVPPDGAARFPASDANKWGAYFSPDGRWVAYTGFQRNRTEAYVQSYPDGGQVRRISEDGGREPVWCGSGELFFRQGRRWMSVRLSGDPPGFSLPETVFDTDFIDTAGISYDVSPKGQRLLVLKRAHVVEAKLYLRVNWM